MPDEHVEEVFEGIARMPQISSIILNRMTNIVSDDVSNGSHQCRVYGYDKQNFYRLRPRVVLTIQCMSKCNTYWRKYLFALVIMY